MLTTWTGRYPAFKEFEYVRKLMETRKTGVIDRQFVDSWLERLQKASPEEVPWLKEFGMPSVLRHVNAAFNRMKNLYPVRDKSIVYFYTCNMARANELAEFPVFRDEWSPRIHVYQSYADYALFYLEKMLDCGMDGVYNDNTFFTANYNWATGNAYIDEKGNIQPSFGLWRLREYHKRQLTLMAKRGMTPWITMHHTNANILPVLGFSTNTMGMEWKYGEQDFQDRFSPDYIRAVCQGRQGGFFPTVLDGIIAKPEERTWATRTMLATLLPHKVRPTSPRQSDVQLCRNILNLMFDFGIAEPDCLFHAYWDKDVPVKSSDSDILVSVYQRGSKMMLVCGSYSKNDAVVHLTVDRSLKNAKKLETGKTLDFSETTVKLPLKKHDFALLEFEIEP